MPKISNKTIKTWHENGGASYEVQVMYLSKVGFYIVIPQSLEPAFKLLSQDDHAKYNTCYHRLSSARDSQPVVISQTENKVIDLAQNVFNHLSKLSIIEKAVIIVYFNDRGSRTVGHEANESHDKIGFEYGLCYATEIKVSQGGKPRYEKRWLYTNPMNESYERKEDLNLWGGGFVIIDDTLESRQLLEQTYELYKQLRERLKTFLTDSDTLLQLIASNQKLIG